MTISSRLDAVAERLSKVRLPVHTHLAIEEAASLSAREKMTTGDEKEMEKAEKRAERKKVKKEWVEVTTQPEKKGDAWVGRATFEYKSGERKGEKQSVMITLPGQAKLSIKSKKVWVVPKDKENPAYFLGDIDPDVEGSEGSTGEGGKGSEPAAPKEPEKKPKGFGEKDDLAPPYDDEDGDGIDDHARVGVPAPTVPVPPKLPRLPNLTDEEREIESRFAEAFEDDPKAMAEKYLKDVQRVAFNKGEPPVFVTDDTKVLSQDYSSDKPIKDMTDEERKALGEKRARNNTLLHQTANAIAKRAFIEQLDQLAKLDDDDPKKSVLVTSGGCGAGKGFSIKNNPDALALKANVGAVWDAAGEQNATENPWIMEECRKRGIKANFVFVDADPMRQWSHDKIGVMARAKNAPPEGEGRMVDARLMADSYVMGAKNMKAFHDKNKDSDDANFIFIDTWDTDKESGFPKIKAGEGINPKSMELDADDLYEKLMGATDKSPTEAIKEGATKGKRIWPPEEKGEKKAASVSEWLLGAGFVYAEDEDAEPEEEAEKPAEDAEDPVAQMAADLMANLDYNQKNPEQFYAAKAEMHDAITHGEGEEAEEAEPDEGEEAEEAEPDEGEEAEEDMDEGMQGLNARIDAVAERLSGVALSTEVRLLVEEAASAVSAVRTPASDLPPDFGKEALEKTMKSLKRYFGGQAAVVQGQHPRIFVTVSEDDIPALARADLIGDYGFEDFGGEMVMSEELDPGSYTVVWEFDRPNSDPEGALAEMKKMLKRKRIKPENVGLAPPKGS